MGASPASPDGSLGQKPRVANGRHYDHLDAVQWRAPLATADKSDMNRSGTSTIEFRCLDTALATGGLKVQAVIDGTSLENRWNAKGKWNSPVPLRTWPSDGITPLDLWSSSFDPSTYTGDLFEDDRVAVLTCSCGELMCGGVVARIQFDHDSVTWSDFRHANYLTPQGMGTFVFARSQYDRALAEARRSHP